MTFVDFGSSVVVSLHKLRRLFPKVIHLFWISKTFWQAWLWLFDRAWLWPPFKNIFCSVHGTSGYCSTSHSWGKRSVWENLKKKMRISPQLKSECIRSAAEVRSLLGHQEVLSPFFGLRTDCSPMRYLAMCTFELLVTMHEQSNTQCSRELPFFRSIWKWLEMIERLRYLLMISFWTIGWWRTSSGSQFNGWLN